MKRYALVLLVLVVVILVMLPGYMVSHMHSRSLDLSFLKCILNDFQHLNKKMCNDVIWDWVIFFWSKKEAIIGSLTFYQNSTYNYLLSILHNNRYYYVLSFKKEKLAFQEVCEAFLVSRKRKVELFKFLS